MSSSPYLLLLLLSPVLALLPVLDLSSPSSPPSSQSLISSLRTDGVLVLTGLGPEYSRALSSLRERAPSCLSESLQVRLDDGSERLTTARDTDTRTQPFPPCVREEVDTITATFDLVDTVVSDILRKEFGQSLDMVEVKDGGNVTREWEDVDRKTHLHVYRQTDTTFPTSLALPYHTDNGLYVLVTPSSTLPLRSLSRDGSLQILNPGDSSILLLLGTGLTSWLLPQGNLHSPTHAVPALSTSLSTEPRTVLARMAVAPALAIPSTAPALAPTFWSHFSAPLDTEQGATLARLRKQRSIDDCSQDWPHACEHGV